MKGKTLGGRTTKPHMSSGKNQRDERSAMKRMAGLRKSKSPGDAR